MPPMFRTFLTGNEPASSFIAVLARAYPEAVDATRTRSTEEVARMIEDSKHGR